MSIGLEVNKTGINYAAGQLALRLDQTLDNIAILGEYLAGTLDADLIAMGYTSGEVAIIKSAFANGTTLRAVYRGEQAVASPTDLRVFLKQLLGLGVTI